MQAKDVMTMAVATIAADATVQDAAKVMVERRVSGLPVVDAHGRVAGMLSEGDLPRRTELGTDRQSSWWLQLLSLADENAAADFVKTHATRVADVMTRPVISVGETEPLEILALLLEKHRIKRVPVLREGRLVGVVSRADLVRRLAMAQPSKPATDSDCALRKNVLQAFEGAGADTTYVGVTVSSGVVHLWGVVTSQVEKQALRVAAENVADARSVEDQISVIAPMLRGALGSI